MKRCKVLAVIILAMVFSMSTTAIPGERHGDFTKHYEESKFQATENGLYGVEIIVKGGELKKVGNQLDIIVHDKKDNDVTGAAVSVTPWMIEMGHGVSYTPQVEEKGGGVYQVLQLDLPMSGKWELRVTIAEGAVEDKAVFTYEIASMMPGMHPAQKVPPDLDTSMSQTGEKERFSVSYSVVTGTGKPPLNKIHSWEISVTDDEGKPVSGATIKVRGMMPRHKHGMPTKPQVTEDLGGGLYLVEGMKFQMPGWWVITFKVRAEGARDKVEFNLMVH